MTTAAQIMCPNPFTLSPTATLAEAMQLLTDLRMSGAPVVDGDGLLVGVISEIAMFDVLFDPSLRRAPVADFMTRSVRTVDVADSLGHVAHMFALYGIRRLPVMRNGALVGIVSRRDLLAYAMTSGEAIADPLTEWIPLSDESCAHVGAVGDDPEEFNFGSTLHNVYA
jgi:CBS domain-containing protein